jgi:hypothetical protein
MSQSLFMAFVVAIAYIGYRTGWSNGYQAGVDDLASEIDKRLFERQEVES